MFLRLIYLLAIGLIFSLNMTGCVQERVVANEERVRALKSMGGSLVQRGDLHQGLKYLLNALELDPNNPGLHHELALVYRDLRQYELSLQHFQKALRLKPDFPIARNNLGTLYILMKRYDLAIQSFQKAIDNLLYRTPDVAYNNMGLAYYGKREYKNAVESYSKAIKTYSQDPSYYANLGLAYEALKRWDNAIEAYENSIQRNPKYPPPYFRLANIYSDLNKKKEAANILKQFLRKVSEGPSAEKARKLLKELES